MDLNVTKDIQRLITRLRLPDSVLVPNIGEVLREYESTGRVKEQSLWRPKILKPGMSDELKVARHYLKTCFPIAHRWKSLHCEIDLLFYHPRLKFIKMIEVKSASQSGFEMTRLSQDQRRRLLGARKYLESFSAGGCELLMAQPTERQMNPKPQISQTGLLGLQEVIELPITAWTK